MNLKKNWAIVKNRYRLSAKIQMNYEMGFPEFLIGKCRCTIDNACEVKTKKVSLSQKGLVFSDTIPLSWFTSSVFIPWEKVQKLDLSTSPSYTDEVPDKCISSDINRQSVNSEYCTLQLNDPMEITIDCPWSEKFTNYIKDRKFTQT